jgi:hypothetical protein
MGPNAALDIAIALMLMYLVLSLIGTVINECIATKLRLRAATLESALHELIDHKVLRDDFYNHGLVDGTKDALNGDHVSYMAGDTFALALLSSLNPAKPIPGFADVKTAIESLPDCNIRDVLLAHLAAADNNLDKLRTGIATYFDNAMDRVSGLYKRYLKWISLGVGFLIVVFLNADTIAVGRALWNDSSLRDQIVQDAGKFVSAGQQAAAGGDAALSDSRVATEINNMETVIRPLPIGWPAPDFPNQTTSLQQAFVWFVIKFFGLAMTALAVSLGAPFWFDMLSKFMNIRGAGTKPDRTASSSN